MELDATSRGTTALFPKHHHCLLVLLLVALINHNAFAQIGDVAGVHDPCIAKCGNSYYVFCTGRRIPIRKSDDLYNWHLAGFALASVPAWTKAEVPNADMVVAPDASFFNGTYHLYYAVSRFGHNNSVIGLETNPTLDSTRPDYHWTDRGKVITTPLGGDWNALDPNLFFDADRQPFLVMGSFWGGIKAHRIDQTTGLLDAADDTLYSLARRPKPDAIEAPFIIRHGEFFYLFVSFDYCCRGVSSTYKTYVGRSRNATGPYEDMMGQSMLKGGGTLVLASQGHIRGPGHEAVLSDGGKDWIIHHYYDADARGRSKLQIRPLLWDDHDWPLAGEPIAHPINAPATSQPATPIGDWRESNDFGDESPLTLAPDGSVNNDPKSGTWSLTGTNLMIRRTATEAPGGWWIETCILSDDGVWFAGHNQAGSLVRGRRGTIDSATRPTTK